MKPARFEYAAPRTTQDALALLARHGLGAKVLAGGQSLVPVLNFRLAKPSVLIDLNGIPGLDTIEVDPKTGEVVIGALARQSDVERAPVVARANPLLVEALRHVGHRTIRNRGTVVGSLAHADPAAELPLVLVTQGGRVKLANARRERWVAAREFFVSYLTTALEPDELVIEARFPALDPSAGWALEEFSRRSGDFALVAACVTLAIAHGLVERCAIGIAGGGPTPARAVDAESALIGQEPSDVAIADAAAQAATGCEFDSDIHGSAEFRRELAQTMVSRALRAARARQASAEPAAG